MKMVSAARIALAAGSLAGLSHIARGQTVINWAAAVSGNWDDAARWSPAQVPNNAGVNTFDARIEQTGAAYTVTLNTAITIENLRVNTPDATLDTAAADLTVNRVFDLTDAVVMGMSNSRVVRVRGAFNTANAALHKLATVDCEGGFNVLGGTDDICDTNIIHRSIGAWSGGNIELNSMTGATTGIRVMPGATFNITGNGLLNTSLGTATFENRGTLNKETGGGLTQFVGAQFVNTGTLNVRSGTLRTDGVSLTANTLDTGTWNISGGSTLDLQGVTVQTNRAKVTIDGVTSSFAAMESLILNDTAAEFTVSGGKVFTTLASSTFNNLGKVTVGSGSRLEVPVSSTLTNYDSGTQTLGGRFDLAGVLRFANTGVTNISGNVTLNGAGAQIQNDSGTSVLTSIRKITTTGVLSLKGATTFTAGGNFLVEGTNSGVLDIEAGSEFIVPISFSLDNYDSGTKTLSQGDFLVQGRLQFEHAGIETLDSKLTLDGGSARLADAADADALTDLKTVNGNGALTLAGSANFTANPANTGGFTFTVAPTGRIAINEGSRLEINGALANYAGGTFTDGDFDVQGTLVADNITDILTISSRIALNSATALITNETEVDVFRTVNLITPTGDFTVGGGRDLDLQGSPVVENRGRFTIGPAPASNSSMVSVQNDYVQTAGRTTLRTNGFLDVGGDFLMTGGELIFDGGRLTTGGAFNMIGGTLGGNGTLNGLTIQGGVINPGTPPPPGVGENFAGGRLLIAGDLMLLNESGIVIEIKGVTPGISNGYDQIDVTGLLGLRGENTLTIAFDPAYRPADGSIFIPIVFGGLEGGRWFGDVRFEHLPADMMVVPLLGSNTYSFMVTTVPAAPAAAVLGLGAILATRRRRIG